MKCKNHQNHETSLSCASCGEGICTDCMVYTPVGVKCRECASPSKGMLRKGKPNQYIGAAVAGLMASVVGGLIIVSTIRASFLVSIILGLLIGEAVRRGAMGNRGSTFMAIAGISSFIGLIIIGFGSNQFTIMLAAITSIVAAFRLSD